METNTELLNRIEAHIKGRLAVAESRAASSELYEGKKIAYNSILGFVRSLRAELAAQAQPAPADTFKGWVARDGHGSLVFSNEKPSRLEWCGWKLWKVSRGTPAVVLPNSIYSALRWEDEPIEVEIIVKTNQTTIK